MRKKLIKEKVVIQSGDEQIEVPLIYEGDREVATLQIDGVFYHFERLRKEIPLSDYSVDADPDYEPHTDAEGLCYILAPFCK